MDSFVPNFNPTKLLHGEQYLKLFKGPLPTSASVSNKVKLVEVLDKGKTAAVTFKVVTTDKGSGEVLCENQSTIILRGSGGFGGKKNGSGELCCLRDSDEADSSDRGPATAQNNPPSRKPDAVIEEKTTLEQAAIYRLSGDYNPLHIDPQFSSMGGFPAPSTISSPFSVYKANNQSSTDSAQWVSLVNTSSSLSASMKTSKSDSQESSFRVKRSLRRCGKRGTRLSSVSLISDQREGRKLIK
jgi:hypothetical protein